MIKKIFLLLFLVIVLSLPKEAQAALAKNTYITYTNPVRGLEGWTLENQKPLDFPAYQLQVASISATPVTWLLRYDALTNATISAFFQTKHPTVKQEIGAFLEVTPSLSLDAGLGYPRGETFFSANRIFLSGFPQEDRIKLIDTYMDAYFARFGTYPKSVGAWHLDSFSLSYLQTKYTVLAAINCDEQYSTDHYRLWGGYFGTPYYPDKNNSLLPADSQKNRVSLPVVRWAQRDLFNAYGTGAASAYSVQINDYLGHKQNTAYFEKLLLFYGNHDFNEYSYLNIGLENDYPIDSYKDELKNVLQTATRQKDKIGGLFVTLSEFGDWYKSRYPESSPAHFYRSEDPTGRESGETFWYMTPHFRIGIKSQNGTSKIIDLRIYNREIREDYLVTPNHQTDLFLDIPAVIDSVKFPSTSIPLSADLTQFKTVYDPQWDMWQVSLENGDQKITFFPDSIEFKNINVPNPDSNNIKVVTKGNTITWKATPNTPFSGRFRPSILLVTFIAFVVFLLFRRVKRKPPKPQLPLLVGLFFATLATFTTLGSGRLTDAGLGFYGPNGHDAVFHLSLIEKFASEPFSLSHPQYQGALLKNYHLVFDYLSGLIVKITSIPSTVLYFRVLPLLMAFVLVFQIEKLLSRYQYTSSAKIFSYFLVFLGGSLGFIPKLLTNQDIFSGESAFWVNQSASMFLNPPYVLSLIIILFLLNRLDKQNTQKSNYIPIILLGAILAQTKVYAFVLICLAMLLSRQYILFFGIGLLGTLLTLPFSSSLGSPFIFDPLWFSRSLFASYDRFYFAKFVSAWQAYEATGNLPRLILLNLIATVVFYLGNLNTRVAGFFELIKKENYQSQRVIKYIILAGLLIPLFIVQKVNPWNTIQFFYYALFFLGLISGKVFATLSDKLNMPVFRVLVFAPLLMLSSFTTIGTLKDYFSQHPSSTVSFSEIAGLETLKKQPRGTVVSPIFVKSGWNVTPKPLYDYVSTAYISAFSGQNEFMSDTINLDITGFQYKERSRDIQKFYQTEDRRFANRFLKDNNIRYVYETPFQRLTISPVDLGLTLIFDMGGIRIYKLF